MIESFYDGNPGDRTLVMRPKLPPYDPPSSGVMFVHGAGSSAEYCLDSYGNQNLVTSDVISEGYTAFSGDNGGPNTWGNSASISGLATSYGRLQSQSTVNADKVALIASSMGGLVAFNWTAQNTSKVSCIVGLIPVINTNDIVVNNRGGYAAAVKAAYGGYSEMVMGSRYNPATIAASGKGLQGVPMLLFCGVTDTVCVISEARAFASRPGMSVTLVGLPGGHSEDTYKSVDRSLIMEFLREHNK